MKRIWNWKNNMEQKIADGRVATQGVTGSSLSAVTDNAHRIFIPVLRVPH